MNILVVRDQITEFLTRSLQGGKHGLKVVPGFVKRALKEEAWKERTIKCLQGERFPGFPSFEAYVTAPVPEGLGASLDLIGRMIAHDAEAVTLFRKATTGKHGGDRKSSKATKGDIVTLDRGRGNSRAYTLDRLQRERADLFEQVSAGQLSANAAAILAGWRKPPLSAYQRILKLIPKLSAIERRQLANDLVERACARQQATKPNARDLPLFPRSAA